MPTNSKIALLKKVLKKYPSGIPIKTLAEKSRVPRSTVHGLLFGYKKSVNNKTYAYPPQLSVAEVPAFGQVHLVKLSS